ncbi:MAG: 50S ribosomal protein L13 [Pelagibacteraceae bacterium]|nr:50S ribosomal protein L13 [Pelagibacteraceae bacterium]
MKTSILKKDQFKKNWHLINAENVSVGRLASRISIILKGKNKPHYSPNLPVGDGVIIINSDKIKFTGKKNSDKKYYRHSGHPGGIKETTPDQLKNRNKSDYLIKSAIKGMLPNTPLFRHLIKNSLKVYKGDSHPHESQNPTEINFLKLNPKNEIHD